MATVLPTKRKRASVNYREAEEDVDWDRDMEHGATIGEQANQDDEISDDDGEYGSRKKPRKKKQSKKPSRVSNPTTKKREEKPLRFLDLPQELHDEIYQLALVTSDPLGVGCRDKGGRRTVARQGPATVWSNGSWMVPSGTAPWKRLSPRLLAVNRQIHSEAVAYLYRQPIVVEDTITLHTFLATIGQSNRLLLADITVDGWAYGRSMNKAMNVAAMTLLSTSVNLQKLHFNVSLDDWGSVFSAARSIHREGHYFLEAYACANGSVDAAINVVDFTNWTNWYYKTAHAEVLGIEEDSTAARSRACKKEFQTILKALLKKNQVVAHD